MKNIQIEKIKIKMIRKVKDKQMNNIVSVEEQKLILADRISMWKRTEYQATVDFKVGEKLEDENMKKAATENIKRCVIALETLEEELKKLL